MAIEEGLKLTLTWTTKSFSLETDCSGALELVKESTPNTSIYAFRINVIRDLLRKRDSILVKIRDGNNVSHEGPRDSPRVPPSRRRRRRHSGSGSGSGSAGLPSLS
jgi:hypothetical protein